MTAYLIRRLLLIVPTLIGIMTINFFIAQLAPGGPVEQVIAELRGTAVGATAQFTGGTGETGGGAGGPSGAGVDGGARSEYRGARGLPPELIADLEAQFGFDEPIHIRYLHMLGRYARLDFGDSFQGRPVIDLIKQALPVSISLGVWTTLLTYLISIPLGVAKAVRDGTRFDIWSSAAVIVGYAVPGFLFAILLIVLLASDRYLSLFPLSGLVSEGWSDFPWWRQILDYLHHMVLPVTAMSIGGFAFLTMLTKNSFLEEVGKQYVLTARGKGVRPRRVLYGHVFRNAMLIVIAGFPAAFISMFFTGSLLIEVIFSLDGLGLLSYQAIIERDYPVVFGTLFIFSLLGLVMNLVSDMTYTWVDPRIDFEARAT